MASFDAISAAITALKVPGSAKGVSRSAIKSKLGDVSTSRVNTALKKAVDSGKLIQIKDSFKLPKPVPKPKKVKKKVSVKKPKKSKKKTPSTGGIMKETNFSDELAAIVGKSKGTRAEANKAIWTYCKANGLQSPDDGRVLLADDKLMPLFQQNEVHGFKDLGKILSANLYD